MIEIKVYLYSLLRAPTTFGPHMSLSLRSDHRSEGDLRISFWTRV